MGRKKQQESGQALVEYIILLSMTLGFVVFFIHKLTGSFDKSSLGLGGKMEKQLRTGSAPASLWTK